MHILNPGTYFDFIDHVAPVLQERSLMQTDYRAGTLREKLFSEGARVNARHPAAGYRGMGLT
ncbi:Dimethyl-sulfide monooxygenase [compost metagenome]